ncbi:hypothetical protein QI442_09200 [Staphylococcus aureus]|nr:hypothetical protein [Staphylococcus aureus]
MFLTLTIHDTDDGRFFNEHKHANNKLLKHSLI